MKKCKLALVGLLLVLSMGVLVACGNEKNEETNQHSAEHPHDAVRLRRIIVLSERSGGHAEIQDRNHFTIRQDSNSGCKYRLAL